MMMRDSWFRKVAKCLLLLTLTGVLWSLPFVRSETCDPNLNIRPVVDISASPENSRLPIGASVTLTCTAEPRTIDAGYLDRWVNYIEWYDPQDNKVGAKCQQPSNMREYKRKLSCPLVLKNLTAEKFGRYTCQSGNGYIKHCTRKSFEIVIQGHGPELLGVPQNQSADVGANVTFSCTATGLPAPSISWIKNNDSFALQSNPRVTFNNNPLDGKTMQSQLFITGVKKEDFGEYQCEAKNSGGQNLSLPAFLTSKGPGAQIPEIVEGPKNQSVSISSNAIFNCTAKGFPRPSIHWIKDNTSYPIQSNPRASVIQDDNNIRSQLLITGVQKDDYGKYQCIAKNSAGGKESGVVFLIQRNFEMPEIVEDPKSQTYSIGSNHFFSCTATGLPRPNIIWIKNNDPNVTKTNPRLEIVLFLNDTKFHSVLLIKEATEEDAGTYQCFAKNSAGEKKSNVATLHIKEARLQETSTLQISIPVTVSFIAATVLINGVLGLWWYKRCKRDTKPLGQRKVAKVHMSNGKCATVLIAQEAEEAPSLEDKLEEGLLQYPKNNGLHDM